jgi:hypothetical protein
MNNLWGTVESRLKAGCGQDCPPSYWALLLCLILAGCGGGLAKRGPVDPALAAFVPPDTVALAGIRVDQLRATPLYRKLAGRFPTHDIHDLLLASDGENVLAVARGAFPGATEYKGFTLYGDNAAVRAAIERSKSGARAPRDLMARAQSLPGDTQVWAVVSGWRGATPEQLRAMGNLANLDRVLRQLKGASLTIDLRSGVHAAFVGDARTDAEAGNLADSLRGLASIARMGAPRSAPGALDGIRVEQEGRLVRVNADIPEDLAEKLMR